MTETVSYKISTFYINFGSFYGTSKAISDGFFSDWFASCFAMENKIILRSITEGLDLRIIGHTIPRTLQ